jgi:hypothetical protein
MWNWRPHTPREEGLRTSRSPQFFPSLFLSLCFGVVQTGICRRRRQHEACGLGDLMLRARRLRTSPSPQFFQALSSTVLRSCTHGNLPRPTAWGLGDLMLRARKECGHHEVRTFSRPCPLTVLRAPELHKWESADVNGMRRVDLATSCSARGGLRTSRSPQCFHLSVQNELSVLARSLDCKEDLFPAERYRRYHPCQECECLHEHRRR